MRCLFWIVLAGTLLLVLSSCATRSGGLTCRSVIAGQLEVIADGGWSVETADRHLAPEDSIVITGSNNESCNVTLDENGEIKMIHLIDISELNTERDLYVVRDQHGKEIGRGRQITIYPIRR